MPPGYLRALSQESRLGVVRLLLAHGPNGIPGRRTRRAARDAGVDRLVSLERAGAGRPGFGDPPRPADHLCRADRRSARACCPFLPKPAAAAGRSCAAISRLCCHPSEGARPDDAGLQRAVSLHPQLGPLDHRRGDREPLCRRALPCLFGRFGPAEAPMPEVMAKLRALGHDVSGPAQQILAAVHRARGAAPRFRDRALRHVRRRRPVPISATRPSPPRGRCPTRPSSPAPAPSARRCSTSSMPACTGGS